MNRKIFTLLFMGCFLLTSCSKPSKPYISEVKSKTVDARSGQVYAQYAIYNPVLLADAGIEATDVEFTTGTYILLSPTEEELKNLSDMDFVSLFYNQRGQIIIEIKGK